jgi:hypothetical protein
MMFPALLIHDTVFFLLSSMLQYFLISFAVVIISRTVILPSALTLASRRERGLGSLEVLHILI